MKKAKTYLDDMVCSVEDNRDQIRIACLWAVMGRAYRCSSALSPTFISWIESHGLKFKIITNLTIARANMVHHETNHKEYFGMTLRVTVEGRTDDDERSPVYSSHFYIYPHAAVELDSL